MQYMHNVPANFSSFSSANLPPLENIIQKTYYFFIKSCTRQNLCKKVKNISIISAATKQEVKLIHPHVNEDFIKRF